MHANLSDRIYVTLRNDFYRLKIKHSFDGRHYLPLGDYTIHSQMERYLREFEYHDFYWLEN